MLCLLMLAYPGGTAYAGAPSGDSGGAPPSARPDVGYYYAVQIGDTLWDVAAAHHLTLDELIAPNGATDFSTLMPGQTIFVPAEPAVVPRRTPPPTPVPTQAPPPAAPQPAPPQPANPPAAAPAQPGSPPATAAEPAAAPAPPPPTPAPEPPAPAPAAAAPAPDLPSQPAGWPEAILNRINEKRAANHLPALVWSAELAAAAQAHADDCSARSWGSHGGSDGSNVRARAARAGYAASVITENWANAASVESAFSMWWNERPGNDPHRRNILATQYCDIGIGIAVGSWGFYFVADFGRR